MPVLHLVLEQDNDGMDNYLVLVKAGDSIMYVPTLERLVKNFEVLDSSIESFLPSNASAL
jgi:hypothetical protein